MGNEGTLHVGTRAHGNQAFGFPIDIGGRCTIDQDDFGRNAGGERPLYLEDEHGRRITLRIQNQCGIQRCGSGYEVNSCHEGIAAANWGGEGLGHRGRVELVVGAEHIRGAQGTGGVDVVHGTVDVAEAGTDHRIATDVASDLRGTRIGDGPCGRKQDEISGRAQTYGLPGAHMGT